MSRARLLKFVILCHRWLGVTWCLLFALWFMSGIVMMYWSFPEVEVADRLRRAPALDASHIQVSPQDAYTRLQPTAAPDQVQLAMFKPTGSAPAAPSRGYMPTMVSRKRRFRVSSPRK